MAMLSLAGTRGDYPMLMLGLTMSALGMGLTMAPSTGAMMKSVPLEKAGVGSAVNDATRELGGALGVAVLGSLLASQFRQNLLPTIHAFPSLAGSAANLGSALGTAASLPGGTGSLFATAARAAFVSAMHITLLVAVVVALVAAGFVTALLRKPRLWAEVPATIEPARDAPPAA
jgi:hypothetical protein